MLPEHAPFSPAQRQSLAGLITSFTPAQRFWLGGFLSAGAGAGAAPAAVASSGASTPLTILYGSESGNSEKLADLSAKKAKQAGFKTVVKNMADVTPSDLGKVENLLVIVSTWGEGDPPETATPFHKAMMAETLSLPKLRFSVCALGDTSYVNFCQTGKDVDARLEAYGATRIFPRQDCDLDYEDLHAAWLENALKAFGPASAAGSNGGAGVEVISSLDLSGFGLGSAAAAVYDKKNPFQGELLERVLLNGEGTAKETWHYEISLEGSGLSYQPGDALGVVPVNAPDVVEGLLKAARLKGTETVEISAGVSKPLADALREDFDITALSRSILTKLGDLTKSKKLAKLLSEQGADQFRDYLWGRWIADAIRDFAAKGLPAKDLVSLLRKLPARLYSIASSPLAHEDEVHLTVASVRYHAHGLDRKGVTSTYLADLVQKGGKVPVYVNENKNFRLPDSADTPIIMVGPGTGVAPFRAFVEHRGAQGNAGKSWLFFGDQRYTYDFLYQTEWQDHLASKALTKLDVAFSRDQPEKIYVQHKLTERSKELYSWLQDGAHFYVCGDASRMAQDVHEALLAVIEKESGNTRAFAEAYVEDLKKTKRYQRDVY
ncbi:MAG: flavodoxin domain-containing protein [Verrucomicrobiota bacterium]